MPRIDGPSPPTSGPGSAMGDLATRRTNSSSRGKSRQRKKKKLLTRISPRNNNNGDDDDDDTFLFVDDLKAPKLKKQEKDEDDKQQQQQQPKNKNPTTPKILKKNDENDNVVNVITTVKKKKRNTPVIRDETSSSSSSSCSSSDEDDDDDTAVTSNQQKTTATKGKRPSSSNDVRQTTTTTSSSSSTSNNSNKIVPSSKVAAATSSCKKPPAVLTKATEKSVVNSNKKKTSKNNASSGTGSSKKQTSTSSNTTVPNNKNNNNKSNSKKTKGSSSSNKNNKSNPSRPTKTKTKTTTSLAARRVSFKGGAPPQQQQRQSALLLLPPPPPPSSSSLTATQQHHPGQQEAAAAPPPALAAPKDGDAQADGAVDAVPPNRTAIAFDTRFIDTPQGHNTGTMMIDEYEMFLASLESRGAIPSILACTCPKTPKQQQTKKKKTKQTKQNSSSSSSLSVVVDREELTLVRQRNMISVQIGQWKNGNFYYKQDRANTNTAAHSTSSTCEKEDDAVAEQEEEVGIPPTWIAVPPPPTQPSSSSSSNSNNNKNNDDDTNLKKMATNTTIKSTAVSVAKPLLAHSSWNLFGDIVEAILEEDCRRRRRSFILENEKKEGHGKDRTPHCRHQRRRRPPLDITIVTNDLSLFCDVKDASHKRNMSMFWDKVQPFYQDGTVKSMHIAVAKTGMLAMVKPQLPPPPPPLTTTTTTTTTTTKEIENGATKEDTKEEGQDKSPTASSADPKDDDMMVDTDTEEGATAAAATAASSCNEHEVSIANCIRVLHAHLKEKEKNDYRVNRNYNKPTPPVDIQISLMDATSSARLGFKSLVRRCLRDVVESVSSAVMQESASSNDNAVSTTSTNTAARIRLELPKTLDGNQCSFDLDLRYKLVPFKLDRPTTSGGFFQDLKLLGSSKLEIAQMVPLDCVDAALLYGIPMEVRTALLDDCDRYQELLVLVRCLFRAMQQEQNAMLLRIVDEEEGEDDDDVDCPDGNDEKGIFHNSRRAGQLFLLMANEAVGGRAHPSSSTGVLYRYASADDFLLEPDNSRSTVDPSVVPEEVEKQYEAYVDDCMAMLEHKGVNPLHLDAVASSKPSSSSSSKMAHASRLPTSNDNNPWSDHDKTGVGSLVASGGGDSDDMSLDDDDYNVGFNIHGPAFDYD